MLLIDNSAWSRVVAGTLPPEAVEELLVAVLGGLEVFGVLGLVLGDRVLALALGVDVLLLGLGVLDVHRRAHLAAPVARGGAAVGEPRACGHTGNHTYGEGGRCPT